VCVCVCVCIIIKTVSIIICIGPTGLRLRHIGKTDPQCGTVQFCFHSGRLTCSARTGFRAVTTPLLGPLGWAQNITLGSGLDPAIARDGGIWSPDVLTRMIRPKSKDPPPKGAVFADAFPGPL